MSHPTPNIPLLRKAMEWVELEATKPIRESQWDQSVWVSTPDQQALRATFLSEHGSARANVQRSCGTTYCVAGYTCMVAGENFRPGLSDDHQIGQVEDGSDIADRAAELLGLTETEADSLFHGFNDIDRVRTAATNIAARAGEVL